MGLTRFAINLAIKNEKIESFDTYLFVGPHPDDIEIGAGATVSKLVSLGKKVIFLICTDGRYGMENIKDKITPSKMASIRKNECLESAKFLGINDVRFLDLEDGGNYTYEQLTKGIAKVINEVKPDCIFAPDPDVISECHKDHLLVGKACKELANFANYKDILANYLDKVKVSENINVKAICLYMTNKPNKYVRTNRHFKKQLEAILFHASQYPKDHEATKSVFLYLKLRAIEFGLKKCCSKAEGFRMMNRTRMHCLPEACK